ncbi:MAG TPA: signal peptidase I [Vicinamibacteria bacterium]|nr:signal peptidase I [Vicinamibacteria bacterium]
MVGRNKRDDAKKSEKSTLREYFESICVAVILALFIRTFVFQAFKIPTGSMEENLLIGDHLIVNKMLYAPTATALETVMAPVREVKRQDVVVFKFPAEPERDFIKRVIALPGERIAIKNKQVFIDGVPLDEPYVFFNEPPGNPELGSFADSRRDSMPEMLVPQGHYFVMGDNRDNSHDSRFWGTLPAELLKGRALMIYWSYDAPDGRDAYFKEGLDRIIEVLSVIPYFVTHTRWDRFFHLVH